MILRSLAISIALAAPAFAAPTVGQTAPAFTATDSNGKTHRLSDFRGKPVILEWTNAGCPFVKKHYASGNMQSTQAAATKAGAIWLTVNSGAPGKQGHVDGKAANALLASEMAKPTAYLLDPAGTVGRAYDAKTTPHIYVIDAKGMLAYQGAIDDKPTSDVADIKGAKNLALAALTEVRAGKPVTVASSKPYGCSIKYG